MGKSFKRRWNKTRIQRLHAIRNSTDELLNTGSQASETVREIIQTLSEPEPPVEPEIAVENIITEPVPAVTAPKKRRRRTSKKVAKTTVE